MNNTTDFTQSYLIKSSFLGLLRGLCVDTLIYPLGVVKVHQQCSSNSENCARVALGLFKEKGFGTFYNGLRPQLLKTSLKAWYWPLITGIPLSLQQYQLGDFSAHAITGFSIATVDAVITTPLERIRILSAYNGKVSFSLKAVYKDGWQGFTTHFSKLSVNWVTFLTAQKYLRNQNTIESHPLSLPQLTKIGVQVAIIVSLIGAPFDFANTVKQAQNISPSQLLLKNGFSKLYRGWPLSFLSLLIHNIASVIVIDKLNRP